MSALRERLDLASRLALEAGALQRSRYETALSIETKSADVDLVTEVDRACEALVIRGLREARPGESILAEEGGGGEIAGASWRWIIDPLDGTTNYAHAYPRFCISIAAAREGSAQVGVVYDPLLGELYQAVRGGGAYRNGARIRPTTETCLDRALLATGFAYDRRESDHVDNLAEFGALLKQARAVRRDGSAALDLCYVAAGRLDGYWELDLSAWDVAAGALIVDEAGGRSSDRDGGDAHWSGGSVVATNGRLHDALLAALAGAR